MISYMISNMISHHLPQMISYMISHHLPNASILDSFVTFVMVQKFRPTSARAFLTPARISVVFLTGYTSSLSVTVLSSSSFGIRRWAFHSLVVF